MIKTVNGKRYDTEAATKVCDWSVGAGLDKENTALYRTAKGAWFIAGQGGPMTQWRQYLAGRWATGEGLRPVNRDEARALLIDHGTPELVEQWFPVVDA